MVPDWNISMKLILFCSLMCTQLRDVKGIVTLVRQMKVSRLVVFIVVSPNPTANQRLHPNQLHSCSVLIRSQVPRVFIGEECVGGGSDVAALEDSGKLKGMLQSIGALQWPAADPLVQYSTRHRPTHSHNVKEGGGARNKICNSRQEKEAGVAPQKTQSKSLSALMSCGKLSLV